MADCFLMKSESDNKIPFISSIGTNIVVSNATEISGSVECNIGDMIVAFVMFRDSNPLSTPDGWENIIESNLLSDDDGVYHKIACVIKIADTDGENSFTINQTSANRMGLILIALKNCRSIVYNSYFDIYHTGTEESPDTKPFYSIPQKSRSEYMLYTATAAVWTPTTTYKSGWKIKNNSLRVIQASGEDYLGDAPRICVIDNIIGNDIYNVKADPESTDSSFILLGLELIP